MGFHYGAFGQCLGRTHVRGFECLHDKIQYKVSEFHNATMNQSFKMYSMFVNVQQVVAIAQYQSLSRFWRNSKTMSVLHRLFRQMLLL